MVNETATMEALRNVIDGGIPVAKAKQAEALSDPGQYLSTTDPGRQSLQGDLAFIGPDGKAIFGDPDDPRAKRTEYSHDGVDVVSEGGNGPPSAMMRTRAGRLFPANGSKRSARSWRCNGSPSARCIFLPKTSLPRTRSGGTGSRSRAISHTSTRRAGRAAKARTF